MRLNRRLSVLAFLVSLVSTRAVLAAEGAEPPIASSAPVRDVAIRARSGVFADPGHDAGGLLMGIDAAHRRGPWLIGLGGEIGGSLFTRYATTTGYAAVGWSAPTPSWFRLELLGTGGVHDYRGVGAGMAPAVLLQGASPEGVRATLPFLGARVRGGFAFGPRAAKLLLGIEGLFEQDLDRVRRTAPTLSFVDAGAGTARQVIGSARLAAALTLGGAFDL